MTEPDQEKKVEVEETLRRATKALKEKEKKEPGFHKQLERLATEKFRMRLEADPDLEKRLDDEFKKRRRLVEQKYRTQVVTFRIWIFTFLLVMMALETIAIFTIVIFNSLPSPLLDVDKLTLQVLVGATIAQVSAMFIVIIKSVFSDKLNEIIMSAHD